jgi:hypothetical protein
MTKARLRPLTFAAMKRAEKSQWAIGDALLEEIGPPRAGKSQERAFADCAAELEDAGISYSQAYLRALRNIAHKFDLDDRTGLGVRVAMEAGTPAVLAKAEALAEEEGAQVTKRFVAMVRKASQKQERRAKARSSDLP